MRTLAVLALLAGLAAAGPPSPALAQPEPPRRVVDTSPVLPSGRTLRVPAGGDLQAALDAAQPGDAVVLAAGATFRGPFTLPRKAGPGWIVVRSAAEDRLPPPGTRVRPAHAAAMPKLEAPPGAPALQTAPGARHFRLVGIEVAPAAGTWTDALIRLGTGDERDEAALPHDLVVERCYIHGDPVAGGRRGIALNSRSTAIVDSHLSDFKAAGQEAQAILGWNGPGPYRIANNYLEAAGENVMFGGADPALAGLVPADIEIRGNHFSKPLAWNPHAAAGGPRPGWTVKNLFELKNARRVLVEGNLFEHNWVGAQSGFAILFTVRNQDGGAPWSTVEDVTFRGNVVRRVAAGINVLGRDDVHPSRLARRLLIADNVFDEVGGARWGGGGRLFQLLGGAADVVIDHNTAFHAGNVVTAEGPPHRGFVFTNNVAAHNEYGVTGTGTGVGTPTLERYFPGARFARNVLAGGPRGRYPADNFFPPSLEAAGFAGDVRGGVALRPASRYRGAGTDGRDLGADPSRVAAALAAAAPVGDARAAAPAAAAAGVVSGAPPGAAAVFWVCVLALGYVYAGYPALVIAWAALRPRPVRRAPVTPTVSVLLVAHDEAARIDARLDNLLALDYPRERLEILLGSDGSTDGTAARARRREGAGVRVFAWERRRGKPAVLNDLARQAQGEILVLGDARQRYAPDALRALMAPFADPEVGAVSGELVLTREEGSTVGEGVGVYWRYEKRIRASESRLSSTVGATGAIYAVRRALFEPIPADTILDDVLIPLRIARRGYRVVFEPGARAWDRAAASSREEFTRKVRTIGGNFQLFAREWRWLLVPWHNRLLLQTVSHKGLRLLSPVLVVGAFAANCALVEQPFYAGVLALQLGFYGAAAAGAAQGERRRSPLLAVPYVFCLLNDATVVAFVRFARGRQPVTWERAQEPATQPWT